MKVVLLGGPLDGRGLTVNKRLPEYLLPYPMSRHEEPKTIETYRQHPMDKAMYEHVGSRPYYLHDKVKEKQ